MTNKMQISFVGKISKYKLREAIPGKKVTKLRAKGGTEKVRSFVTFF